MFAKGHTAFWSVDFRLSDKHCKELEARGIPDSAVRAIENHLRYLKSYYATNPPKRMEQRQRIQELHDRFVAAKKAMDKLDDLTAEMLDAKTCTAVGYAPLLGVYSGINAYVQSSHDLMVKLKPSSGPDATQSNHVASLVALALRAAGIPLDDSTKGAFVVATGIALEAFGIERSDPRNEVRRVLKDWYSSGVKLPVS